MTGILPIRRKTQNNQSTFFYSRGLYRRQGLCTHRKSSQKEVPLENMEHISESWCIFMINGIFAYFVEIYNCSKSCKEDNSVSETFL